MSRKHPAPSRKRRGLRWLAILAALVLFNACTGIYPLLPSQALSSAEGRYSPGDAETARAVWDGGRLVYLRHGLTHFSISEAAFHLLGGWYATAPLEIPLDSERPWGAWIASSGTEARIVLFGFVPEGEEPPELSIRTAGHGAIIELDEGEIQEAELFTPQADIPGAGGGYFLRIFRCPIPQRGYAMVGYIREDGTWAGLEYYRTGPG